MITPPYVATYATNNPYITPEEFNNSPTGVDTAALMVGSGQSVNLQALVNVIERASGWADALCKQKLAATIDTRTGSWRVSPDGFVQVPLPYFPILGVVSVSAGWTPSTMATLTQVSDVWIGEDGVASIPVTECGRPFIYLDRFRSLPAKIYCTVQYVNGWFNAQSTVAAPAGATSLTVSNTLGVNAGQMLHLYGTGTAETVTVASDYVATANTGPGAVTLTSPTLNAYAVGDTLTAMPAAIKQAVILLTGILIRTRGAEAFAMQNINSQPSMVETGESAPNSDFAIALDMLERYTRGAV